MTLSRALRLALAIALVAVASGLPAAVSALLDDDCCAERCDGAADGKGCPPGCTQVTCVKAFSTALPPSSRAQAAPVRRGQSLPAAVLAPVLPLVARGVFHPPRA